MARKGYVALYSLLALVVSLSSFARGSTRNWSLRSTPNSGSTNFLNGVAAISDSDAWAVGYEYDANDNQFTVVQHWDGKVWSAIPSPSPGTAKSCGDPSYAGNMLFSVSAVSSTDVWAVGQICTYSNARTLTEHWDGTRWQVVPSPNEPGFNASSLVSVIAIASDNVWAVGNYEVLGGYEWMTLVEHWDGSQWAIVESPNVPGAYENFLVSVAAASANDVWAVGNSVGSTQSAYEVPLIEHYDGNAWTVVPSVFPAPSDYNWLSGVSVNNTNDVWAVGYANENDSFQNGEALIERWDGTKWSLVVSPIAGSATLLNSVAVLGANNVWAVGYIQTNNVQWLPVTEHWNGSKWSVVTPPNPGAVAQLFGVAGEGRHAWAVGAYSTQPNKFGYMEDPLTLALGW